MVSEIPCFFFLIVSFWNTSVHVEQQVTARWARLLLSLSDMRPAPQELPIDVSTNAHRREMPERPRWSGSQSLVSLSSMVRCPKKVQNHYFEVASLCPEWYPDWVYHVAKRRWREECATLFFLNVDTKMRSAKVTRGKHELVSDVPVCTYTSFCCRISRCTTGETPL